MYDGVRNDYTYQWTTLDSIMEMKLSIFNSSAEKECVSQPIVVDYQLQQNIITSLELSDRFECKITARRSRVVVFPAALIKFQS